MDFTLGSRIKSAWNAFRKRDPTDRVNQGPAFVYRPDRTRLTLSNERSIISAIYNRIAMDVAAIDIQHAQ